MQFIVQGYPAYAYTGAKAFDPTLPAIVLVHGAALDHSVWQWQSRYFAHHGHAVLAVDLPGHGRSPGALRTTIEALADWIAALIVAAKRDQMAQFKAGQALAGEIPGAEFVALDAGHSMMSEAPRETLDALRRFLR